MKIEMKIFDDNGIELNDNDLLIIQKGDYKTPGIFRKGVTGFRVVAARSGQTRNIVMFDGVKVFKAEKEEFEKLVGKKKTLKKHREHYIAFYGDQSVKFPSKTAVCKYFKIKRDVLNSWLDEGGERDGWLIDVLAS